MESRKEIKFDGLQDTFSRRDLLKGAAVLTAAVSVPQAFGQQPTGVPFGSVWLYIGTYTGAPGAFGSNGMSIYLCELNLSTGNLTVLRLVAPVVTPRFKARGLSKNIHHRSYRAVHRGR